MASTISRSVRHAIRVMPSRSVVYPQVTASFTPVHRHARTDSQYTKSGELSYHARKARTTPGRRALNPRKQYIASQILRYVVDQPMAVVVHYNSMNSDGWQQIRNKLSPLGCKVSIFPNFIVKRVLEQTRFRNMAPLFWSATCVVSGDNLDVLKKVIKIFPSPTFEVLGGKIDESLLTRDELVRVSELPSLDIMRATLLATLQGPSQHLHTMLTSSQSDLVASLQRYSNPASSEATSEEAE
eukprot:m.1519672 g.1519672  ORF g.1519672 m.1519672 type:complete len:241 (+) comp25225_c1_seq5:184-906(+)